MKKFILILCLIIPTVVSATTFEWKAQVGFRGYHKVDSWTPLTISIENNVTNLTGMLQLELEDLQTYEPVFYQMPVELPQHSNKQYQMYVRFERYSSHEKPFLTCSLDKKIQYRGEHTKKLKYEISELRRITTEDYLIVVVGSDDLGLNNISGNLGGGDVRVVNVSASELPTQWYGYDSADMVILGDLLFSNFSKNQRTALEEWVVQGGTLVFAGGKHSQVFRNAFFADLLPVTLDELITVDGNELQPLANYYNQRFFNYPEAVPLCKCTPHAESRVLFTNGAHPLVITKPYGVGKTIFFSIDFGSEPLREWLKKRELFYDLLTVHHGDSNPNHQWLNQVTNILFNIPAMQMPSFGFIIFFLALYVIIVGPINYFILRWQRRLELAWVTIPIIVVIFSVGAYFIGYAKKGSKIVVKELTIIEGSAGQSKAKGTTYFSFFSPKKTKYDIFSENQTATLRQFVSQSYQQSDPVDLIVQQDNLQMKLTEVEMPMWSLSRFETNHVFDLEEGISADLIFDGKKLNGTLTNQTGYTFTEGYIFYAGKIAPVLDNGKKLIEDGMYQIDRNISNFGSYRYIWGTAGNDMMAELHQFAEEYLNKHHADYPRLFSEPQLTFHQPVFVGFIDQPVFNVTSESSGRSRRQDQGGTIVLIRLPYTLQGMFSLPEEAVLTEVSRYDASTFYTSYQMELSDGSCEIDLTLPQTPSEINEVRLAYNITASSQQMISVYNWDAHYWDQIDSQARTTLLSPEYIYFPLGRVRVRLETADSSYQSIQLSKLSINVGASW